jgi:hypothetical protein
MACHDKCYLPIPPRAWSRVQNSCSVETTDSNNSLVRVPYTNQIVPGSEISFYLAMQNKGNVLQYKANSSNFTKNQIYSLAAKGQWLGKTTGVQSTRGYTNPNSTSLQRTGNVVNVAIDPNTGLIIGPTTAPVTCPTPIRPFNPALPNNGGGGGIAIPPIPPVINPDPGSIIFPPIIPVTPVEPIVIQDGGTLVCSVKEIICTGKTSQTLSQKLCNLTTDSDVPGPIQPLCWNDGNPTWYPRQRYTMSNSTNKWPVNATLSSAIKPYPPIITSISSNINVVTLTWTQDESCLSVSNFYIYQNGILINIVAGTVFSTNIIVENCNFYQYFIVGVTNGNDVFSDPSNIESINIAYANSPINLTYTVINYNTYEIQLTWINPIQCIGISYYKIYQDGGSIIYTSTTNDIIITLSPCNNYSFYVTAISINGEESLPSNIINSIINYNDPPILDSCISNAPNEITLSWSAPILNCCSIVNYKIYYDNGTSTQSILVSPSTNTYTITGLTNGITYTFYVSYFCSSQESTFSNSLSATPQELYSITGTYYINNNFLYITGNSSITFNYNCDINFTLVGGGSGGGSYAFNSFGTTGGGGGQVLNTNGSITVLFNDIWDITIGQGGFGGNRNGANDGDPGSDTQIVINSLVFATTENITSSNLGYGGGGGFGSPNHSGRGGGGPGPNPNCNGNGTTSSFGGSYSNTSIGGTAAGGGGGGSLTDFSSGIVTLNILGDMGFSAIGATNTGGNGGNGQLGIDSNYYGGGGGGGGGTSFGGGSGGIGGLGGGGNGNNFNTIGYGEDGTSNTGGGGGGWCNIGPPNYGAGNGGSGIAIFTIALSP